MNTVFRADANSKIGAGHLMRSCALAQACLNEGFAVTFVTNCKNDLLKHKLLSTGFKTVFVDASYPSPNDIRETRKALNQSGSELCIVDGYHFDSQFQSEIRKHCHLMVIDDTAHLDSYPADIILNQNIDSDKLSYKTPKETVRLLGTEFVMLREEFLSINQENRKIPEQLENILVTFGAGDSQNQSLKAIRSIERIGADRLQVRAVVGAGNPHFEELSIAARDSGLRIELIRNADNMAELMLWADLAVSAAGSTCWEMAYLGLPAILISTAQNQVGIANGLDREGFAKYLGTAEDVTIKDLSNALKDFLKDPSRIGIMGSRGTEIVDGLGCKRIIERLTRIVSAKKAESR